MRTARGLILLLIAPAMAAAQSIGPPADPGGGNFPVEPAADVGAGLDGAGPGAPLEAGEAADAAPTDGGGAVSIELSRTESLPLGGTGEAAPLGSQRSSSAGGLGVGRTVISLVAVVSLLALLAAACRQWASSRGGLAMAMGAGGRAPSGVLEVLGRYPISRGLTLVLLKIDRRVLLLAQTRTGRLGTGTSLRALCEMSDPEEVASVLSRCRDEAGESLAGKFRSMLSQFEATDEELGVLDDGEPLRLVEFSTDGDRVELWDTGDDEGDAGAIWDDADPYAQRGVG